MFSEQIHVMNVQQNLKSRYFRKNGRIKATICTTRCPQKNSGNHHSLSNGSQVNVSGRMPGEMLGHAAAFSNSHKYPCDIVALEPSTIMMFLREDVLLLMQRDLRILENFTTEIASATYMLQQRLELLSYNGIAQKDAFYLLIQARQTGKSTIRIPESMPNWAMVLNVSRPSLHRELSKLEAAGVISYAPPVIEIKDTDALMSAGQVIPASRCSRRKELKSVILENKTMLQARSAPALRALLYRAAILRKPLCG